MHKKWQALQILMQQLYAWMGYIFSSSVRCTRRAILACTLYKVQGELFLPVLCTKYKENYSCLYSGSTRRAILACTLYEVQGELFLSVLWKYKESCSCLYEVQGELFLPVHWRRAILICTKYKKSYWSHSSFVHHTDHQKSFILGSLCILEGPFHSITPGVS